MISVMIGGSHMHNKPGPAKPENAKKCTPEMQKYVAAGRKMHGRGASRPGQAFSKGRNMLSFRLAFSGFAGRGLFCAICRTRSVRLRPDHPDATPRFATEAAMPAQCGQMRTMGRSTGRSGTSPDTRISHFPEVIMKQWDCLRQVCTDMGGFGAPSEKTMKLYGAYPGTYFRQLDRSPPTPIQTG